MSSGLLQTPHLPALKKGLWGTANPLLSSPRSPKDYLEKTCLGAVVLVTLLVNAVFQREFSLCS